MLINRDLSPGTTVRIVTTNNAEVTGEVRYFDEHGVTIDGAATTYLPWSSVSTLVFAVPTDEPEEVWPAT